MATALSASNLRKRRSLRSAVMILLLGSMSSHSFADIPFGLCVTRFPHGFTSGAVMAASAMAAMGFTRGLYNGAITEAAAMATTSFARSLFNGAITEAAVMVRWRRRACGGRLGRNQSGSAGIGEGKRH